MIDSKRWLSPIEFALEFGIKVSTQAQMRKDNKIPYSKIGNKFIRYDRIKIDLWLEAHAITS